MLKIFNTLTRKKECFTPICSKQVGIYVCGVTIYDFCHIGHARTFIFFDFVVRYLQYLGYTVNYVRNITDIDDKIIRRSITNQESYKQLTDRMILAMHHDFEILNILPPNHEPRVTKYITNIIHFISLLLKKNYAYIASNGDVFFSIQNKKNYNILSRQNIEKLYVINSFNKDIKRHPMDFVLWKRANNTSICEVSWMSPWGIGRPGWHIECSAMTYDLLGTHFDIHGGGTDLIFPHHENELAQSTSIHDTPYVNIWMHVGMVMNNTLKISKSSNNFFTIRNVLKNYDPETIRYFLLSSHYRNSISYTHDNLKKSRIALEHLYLSLRNIGNVTNFHEIETYFVKKFIAEINNDFNTPGAYSILFEIAHMINSLKKKNNSILKLQKTAATLRYLGQLLGLLNQDSESFLKKLHNPYILQNQDTIQKIELLIRDRNFARKNKQWKLADKIRCKLFNLGIKLEDTKKGTTWRYI